jgi:hypothetical protein
MLLSKIALLLFSLLATFVAYHVVQVHLFHSSEFNQVHHRQNTMHMISEAMGIYYRTGQEMVDWVQVACPPLPPALTPPSPPPAHAGAPTTRSRST